MQLKIIWFSVTWIVANLLTKYLNRKKTSNKNNSINFFAIFEIKDKKLSIEWSYGAICVQCWDQIQKQFE